MREICTSGSVGAPGGQPPGATRPLARLQPRHPEAPLLPAAFDLADRLQRTVYDCLYLALAIPLGAKMVTADLRLYNALRGTPEASYLCWIEDVP
jgi:hypothetical protein